jgi:hypothetical protein
MISALADGVLAEQGALTSAMDQVLRAGAGVLAPELSGFASPSPAPGFAGGFGAPAPVGVVAAARGGVTIENLIVTVQGVLDERDPMSMRRIAERIRQAIIDLEQERFANG